MASPTSSSLTAVIGDSAPHLTAFTAILLLLLYGYEIFNFSLSIDEEVHAYDPAIWSSWIAQGRWTMGLLTLVLPPLASIPELSTVLFCAGLGMSACVLARVLFRSHSSQLTFAGIFVSSPLWPHVAQFNTLSWGVGIGCVLLTLSLLCVIAERRFDHICAAGFLAAATGIYQTLYTWFLVLLCLRYLSVLLRTAPVGGTEARGGFPWQRSGVIAVGGLLGYLAVGRLLLEALSLQPTYVEGYFRLADFRSVPADAFARTLQRCWNLLVGADPIFLGYGHVLALLQLLGVLIVVGRLLERGSFMPSQRLVAGASLGAALVFALSPIVVSAGTVPARSLISWIPISAFMAAAALSHTGRFAKALYALLAATLLISIWVSVSLFYSDHLARERDQLLAARLMVRIDNIVPGSRSAPIPFVVIGSVPKADEGGFRRVEVFGDSFFEHDGGNPYRVAYYLRLLGVDTLEPHRIAEVAPHRAVIEAMAIWPAAGSVAMVGGMLVIKLGPMP